MFPGAQRFSGFDARRELALQPHISTFRYIHFSSHIELDNDVPDLSRIELSQAGRSLIRQRGALFYQDIQRMNLAADLVFLAGCRGSGGKQLAGEGLLSITNAFFEAGANAVIGSLWPLDDAVSLEFIAEYYRQLRKSGTPAEALLQARRVIAKRWPSPVYWAGLTLQGVDGGGK